MNSDLMTKTEKQFVPLEFNYLIEWIKERENVRQNKVSNNPKPWTKNPYLRDYRWCNVRRMDDKVSQELLHMWYSGNNETELLVAAVLARMINWPETLKFAYGEKPLNKGVLNLIQGRKLLHERVALGQKLITGAYMIPGVPGKNKCDSISDLAENVRAKAHLILKNSMKETWAELIKLPTVGSFLAGQIVADLAQLSIGNKWEDRHTWAPLGPGSSRGISRLLGRIKTAKVTQCQFEEELPLLIKVLKPEILEIWKDRNLQAMDIQNCLCEFDKYRRLMLKEGSVRAKYHGL